MICNFNKQNDCNGDATRFFKLEEKEATWFGLQLPCVLCCCNKHKTFLTIKYLKEVYSETNEDEASRILKVAILQ